MGLHHFDGRINLPGNIGHIEFGWNYEGDFTEQLLSDMERVYRVASTLSRHDWRSPSNEKLAEVVTKRSGVQLSKSDVCDIANEFTSIDDATDIKLARCGANVPISDIADFLGVTSSVVGKWERGEKKLPPYRKRQILHFINLKNAKHEGSEQSEGKRPGVSGSEATGETNNDVNPTSEGTA